MRYVLALLASLVAMPLVSAPLKVLILTGESDVQYHDWRVSTPLLREQLERTGRFDVTVMERVRGITAETLQGFDALLLNYMGPRWGDETERAVEDFIRGGKGLVSLHGVTYGPLYGMVFADGRWQAGPDSGWSAYPRLIGASWDPSRIGHGRRHVFTVRWEDREHPVARGLPATFLANDELYHRLTLLPETKVLATAYSDPSTGGTGKNEPIVWAAPFGKGRTFHITLGHDATAMIEPGFAAALARGTEWAASGAVTLPVEEAKAKDPVRVLVVTGGHPYPVSFYTLFEGHRDLVWTHATSPDEAFSRDLAGRFDVIVLHDMWTDLKPELRRNLKAFVDAGKGVVSIHHAIVDYTAWPWWWQEVIGGEYFVKAQPGHAASLYKEDEDMVVTPTALGAGHPVTRDVPPLVVNDEAYKGMWHAPGIQVLMETAHPLNDPPVVYIGPNPKAKVVYIQLGHSDSTMRNPGYRKLVRNAVLWSAGRK